MAPLLPVISLSIVEKDNNGDVLWVWTYPTVSKSQKAFVIKKYISLSDQHNKQSFACVKHEKEWFYITCKDVCEWGASSGVKQFALVVSAKDFHPPKYEAFSRILSKTYSRTGDPVKILELYLSGYIRDSFKTKEDGEFPMEQYSRHYISNNVKELISTFDWEIILIYTALLLKKRIVVYHYSLERLLVWISTFPALMKHRKLTDTLVPWVDLNQDELQQLKNQSHYIVGCRDSSVLGRTDLYDLLVNFPAREITVAAHAKESLTMTKTHKEIALFMVQLSNDNHTSAHIALQIAAKTQDLLAQLTSLATVETSDGRKLVSAQTIKEKNLAPAVENFLINLAIAENLFAF